MTKHEYERRLDKLILTYKQAVLDNYPLLAKHCIKEMRRLELQLNPDWTKEVQS